jgi:hypothetical protein
MLIFSVADVELLSVKDAITWKPIPVQDALRKKI